MKILFSMSLLGAAVMVTMGLMAPISSVIIYEKKYFCTAWDCSYEVVVKNNSDKIQSAGLKITGLNTATKYKQAQKVEHNHVLKLKEGESQVIKDQITIQLARVVLFELAIN